MRHRPLPSFLINRHAQSVFPIAADRFVNHRFLF